jgi:formate-dependent nitrite reductase membrane component NrfD
MVPEARFDSYYGRPILKEPTWKADIPFYLFAGGMAGASAVLAEGAAVRGLPALESVARVAAAGSAAAGTVALVHDLGRPSRFLNMLRVLKPTSPMSVGSFVLAPFSGLASVAAASNLSGRYPRLGRLAGLGAGILGLPLATYTAALVADTAIPAWHEAHRELPFVFAGSGAAAAGGVAMVFTPVAQSGPAVRMAVVGAAAETVAAEVMSHRLGLVGEPYRTGTGGLLMKVARGLTAGGVAASVFGGRRRWTRAVGGASFVAGSVLTRFGIFQAGRASARDPKYTVVPQRERLAERQPEPRPAHG